jgi:hypothetical protein
MSAADVWLSRSSDAGLRDRLVQEQDHKCGDCGAVLDGYIAFAVPLDDGRTVAVCNSCGGRLNRLLRRAQRF